MADAPRSPFGGGDAKAPPKGAASKPAGIPPPPPSSGIRGKGALSTAQLPEAVAGVVTGASKSGSSSRPPPPPARKDLPTLAPAKRKGSEPPPAPAGKKVIDADDIDVDIDTL